MKHGNKQEHRQDPNRWNKSANKQEKTRFI